MREPPKRLARPDDYRGSGIVDPDPDATADVLDEVSVADIQRWRQLEHLVRLMVDPSTTLLEEELVRYRLRLMLAEGARPVRID